MNDNDPMGLALLANTKKMHKAKSDEEDGPVLNINLNIDDSANKKDTVEEVKTPISVPQSPKVIVPPKVESNASDNNTKPIIIPANLADLSDDDSVDIVLGKNPIITEQPKYYSSDSDINLNDNKKKVPIKLQLDDVSSIESLKIPNTEKANNNISSVNQTQTINSQNTFNRSQTTHQTNNTFTPSIPRAPTLVEMEQEKATLLFEFSRLEKKGVNLPRKYTMSSNLDEMRMEFNKLKRQKELENGIKFSRKMLMAGVTALEFLNNKFDPWDIQLNGWSESIMENMDDYDDVFEELYDKYSNKMNSPPEIRLMLALGGSAFMFHLSNSMLKNNSISNLMQQGTAQNFMQQQVPPQQQFVPQQQNPYMQQQPQMPAYNQMNNVPPQSNMRQPMNPNVSSTKQEVPLASSMKPSNMLGNMFKPSKSNSKLSGPTGVDDILKEINQVRNSNPKKAIDLDDLSSEITTSSKRSINRKAKNNVLDLNIG